LTAELFFTQRWPVIDVVEKPGRRESLRRLVQVTADADPDKARFWLFLGEAETARWRLMEGRAGAMKAWATLTPPGAHQAALEQGHQTYEGRVDSSWKDAVAAYTAAASFPGFEQRDAALYWLTRLYLARSDY
jgi:hypothetical protein